ncbi:30S ribosomal protein S1, partial [Brachyspira pilosicoli]|nr:30S ribosomal protein S1 [Brachyspira pilosicoli]
MEDNNLSEQQNEFLKALEESDNKTHFKLGSVVSGKIVQFDDTDVFIDFNYKVEGKINRNEFDKEPVKGEEIEAVI